MFDIQGRQVGVLVDNELQAGGLHEVACPVEHLAPGLYVVRLTAGLRQLSVRVVVR